MIYIMIDLRNYEKYDDSYFGSSDFSLSSIEELYSDYDEESDMDGIYDIPLSKDGWKRVFKDSDKQKKIQIYSNSRIELRP